MKNLKFALAFSLAATLGLQSAHAGTVGALDVSTAVPATPTVEARVVESISKQVTYSKPTEGLTTYVAFNVGSGSYLFKNISGNTLNDITVKFKASVTDGQEKLKLVQTSTYLADLAPFCSWDVQAGSPVAASMVTITCFVRQMKAGDEFLKPFTVFYEAPAKVVNNNADVPNSDFVKLDIEVIYAEGTAGSNPRENSRLPIDMPNDDRVTLGTENPTFVKSVVPKNGTTTLFTGVGAAVGVPATEQDPWTTTVIVPEGFIPPTLNGGKYTIATIEEDLSGATCQSQASNLLNCSTSTLTIPGDLVLPKVLKIYLRRDASTLTNPNKPNEIDTAKIFYSLPTNPNVNAGGYPVELPSCSSTNYNGPLPQPGLPCIYERKRYPNSAPSPWARDWEFLIYALDNGRYAQ
jgi:hypothetical protein